MEASESEDDKALEPKAAMEAPETSTAADGSKASAAGDGTPTPAEVWLRFLTHQEPKTSPPRAVEDGYEALSPVPATQPRPEDPSSEAESSPHVTRAEQQRFKTKKEVSGEDIAVAEEQKGKAAKGGGRGRSRGRGRGGGMKRPAKKAQDDNENILKAQVGLKHCYEDMAFLLAPAFVTVQ